MLCKLSILVISSPRSGRQNKAWGGAEGGTPGQVRRAIKPVKRAAATDCRPLCGLRAHYYRALGLTPQALCCRLLRRLKAKALILKTPNNLIYRVFRFFLVYILQAEDRRPQLSRPPLSAPECLLNGISQVTAKLASRACEFCG